MCMYAYVYIYIYNIIMYNPNTTTTTTYSNTNNDKVTVKVKHAVEAQATEEVLVTVLSDATMQQVIIVVVILARLVLAMHRIHTIHDNSNMQVITVTYK